MAGRQGIALSNAESATVGAASLSAATFALSVSVSCARKARAPLLVKVLSFKRKGDALNKQLSEGKITFGEYNIKRVEILNPMALALASITAYEEELQHPAKPLRQCRHIRRRKEKK